MSIAEKELDFWLEDGVAENSEIGRERILEYFAATDFGPANALGFDGEPLPWACAFVSWVMSQSQNTAQVFDVPKASARCNSWKEFGESLSEPVVGAIAVLVPPVGSSSSSFTGFITDIQDDTLSILGGNLDDSVRIRHFSKARVAAVQWPLPIK